ncbi:MAG: tetraacyldisaccharide 4'-kinase [Ignavibacteriae bacterium HGW-Ignavibacteriae-3]|nr:MAG: tetraacyldisaccharide 4'-kinase [Ignavibacteriae bacterium HGW-Ignavibacteriae-3]
MLEFVKILLSPVAVVYSVITKIRNWLFDKNIFPSTKVKARVVSVGNLTVGGSGKTPAVMMIAEMLKTKGIKVGLLSRGYGRNSLGYVFASDGKSMKVTVDQCGDEMYFMADELKLPAAVAERRVSGARNFIKDSNIETIVLDDAFQHRWIYRDLDVVIFDQRFLDMSQKLEQRILPIGSMRESFKSLDRADVIIINRKFSDKIEIPEKLKKYFEGKIIFTGYYEAVGIFDVKTHHFFEMSEFQGQKSLVVCGVARPFSFLNVLEKNKIDFTNKMIFDDHKNYSLNEVQLIRKKFYDTNAYSVLTTQKDAVKFIQYSKELDDIDIYYLKIELRLDDQKNFNDIIFNSINK